MQAPHRIQCLHTLSGVGAIADPRVLPLFGLAPSAAALVPTGPRVWARGSCSAGWTTQPRIEYEQKGYNQPARSAVLSPKRFLSSSAGLPLQARARYRALPADA